MWAELMAIMINDFKTNPKTPGSILLQRQLMQLFDAWLAEGKFMRGYPLPSENSKRMIEWKKIYKQLATEPIDVYQDMKSLQQWFDPAITAAIDHMVINDTGDIHRELELLRR